VLKVFNLFLSSANPRLELCARSGLRGDELKAEQGIIFAQLALVKQLNNNHPEAQNLISDIQSQTFTPPF